MISGLLAAKCVDRFPTICAIEQPLADQFEKFEFDERAIQVVLLNVSLPAAGQHVSWRKISKCCSNVTSESVRSCRASFLKAASTAERVSSGCGQLLSRKSQVNGGSSLGGKVPVDRPEGPDVFKEGVEPALASQDRLAERGTLVAALGAGCCDEGRLHPEADCTDHVFPDAERDHRLFFVSEGERVFGDGGVAFGSQA